MTQLHVALEERYVPYAMSVIMSRALPDARDGLKPAQRRILYTMFHDLDLQSEGRYRKSAAIVGNTLAKYHPHGDSSAYEAMVRMAQDFSLRYPLVDGQGNFGTIDGDSAASSRYTEAKLHRHAKLLFTKESLEVVPRASNFDNTATEPLVLPVEVPVFLLNGAMGIAVGMATNTPPHHVGEVLDALIAYIQNPASTVEDLLHYIKGPDLPTGGTVLMTEQAKRDLYKTGQGSFIIQGKHRLVVSEDKRKGDSLVFTEIPFGVVKADIVTRLHDLLYQDPVMQNLVTSVRDESTQDIRLVIEMKRDASPDVVLSYLFDKCDLEVKFHANMTALAPDAHTGNMIPRKMGLVDVFQTFAEYRLNLDILVARARIGVITKRLHVLKGLGRVLDHRMKFYEILQEGSSRKEIAQALMSAPFDLDQEQVDYVLGLRVTALSKMDEDLLRKQIAELEKELGTLTFQVDEPGHKTLKRIWIKRLQGLKETYGDPRRSLVKIVEDASRKKIDLEALASEDVYVILTQQGWIKAQKSAPDPEKTRVREGDAILQIFGANTAETVCFWTTKGKHYTRKASEITVTAGFGDPVSKILTIEDAERILMASYKGSPQILVISEQGQAMRLDPTAYLEKPSRVSGKQVYKGEDGIFRIMEIPARAEWWIAVSSMGRVFTGRVDKIKVESAYASKGHIFARLGKGETLLEFGWDSVTYKGQVFEAAKYKQAGSRGAHLGLFA